MSQSYLTLYHPMDSLSLTVSRSLPKFMSIELVMISNYLILCCPLLLLPSIFPSNRFFSNESRDILSGHPKQISDIKDQWKGNRFWFTLRKKFNGQSYPKIGWISLNIMSSKYLSIKEDVIHIMLLSSHCHFWLFVTPSTAACQVPLSSTISRSLRIYNGILFSHKKERI